MALARDSQIEILVSNPQAENGHIDIAHEIAESFFNLQLSGNQWRILWIILRQTYGWHKKSDRISISYFQNKSGLQRRHISRALKDLVERNIVTKNDTSFITTYGFQKDNSKWKLSPKMTHITKNDTSLSPKMTLKLSPKLVHTKETKETNTKENILTSSPKTNPDIKIFIDFWYQTFQAKFNKPYCVNGSKEGNLVKKLIQTYKLDPLKTLAVKFFNTPDEFIFKAGYTIGVFYSQINKLAGEVSWQDKMKLIK